MGYFHPIKTCCFFFPEFVVVKPFPVPLCFPLQSYMTFIEVIFKVVFLENKNLVNTTSLLCSKHHEQTHWSGVLFLHKLKQRPCIATHIRHWLNDLFMDLCPLFCQLIFTYYNSLYVLTNSCFHNYYIKTNLKTPIVSAWTCLIDVCTISNSPSAQ